MTLDSRLLGERTEVYGVDLLRLDGTQLGSLPTVPVGGGVTDGLTAGSLTYNLDARIRGTGSLTIMNPSDLIDWFTVRFRPWVDVNGIRWNLGVYIPGSPDIDHLDTGGTQATATIQDKTAIIDRQPLAQSLSLPAGAWVTSWVEQLIFDTTGESITGVVPSDKSLRSAMTWPPGTSPLTVINDLLASVGYNALWTDLDGLFIADPWVDPASQVPSVVFAEGDSAIHSAKFTVTQDILSVPNQVIRSVQGDDSNKGLISVAENHDPTSPYSIERRGGVTSDFAEVEASDQATLDGIAQRDLKANSRPPWYVAVSHAVVPLVGRQVLQFTSDGIDRQVTVNEWGVTMTPGALMTGKWLGVTL